MKNIILNNLGLKGLALFLAVMTWLYIVAELEKGAVEEREALERILPYRMISKRIAIELDIVERPQEEYKIVYDEIVVNPPTCVMVGPKSLLRTLSSLKTEPIDLSDYKKTFTKNVSIVPPLKGITIKEKFVSVTIPIIKVKD